MKKQILFSVLFLCLYAYGQSLTPIFQENFNTESQFSQWIFLYGDIDDPDAPTWQWQPYGGSDQGGCISISSTDRNYPSYYRCLGNEKFILSPPIEIGDIQNLNVSFDVSIENVTPAENKLFLCYVGESDGKMKTIAEVVLKGKKGNWVRNEIILDRSQNPMPYSVIRMGFYYLSPANQDCGDIYYVDQFSISEINTVNHPPQTNILIPEAEQVEVRKGRSLYFEGSGSDPDGDEIEYWWRVCPQGENCEVEGKTQDIVFNQTGVFEIICWAQDSNGASDPTPDRRIVRVVDNRPPVITKQTVFNSYGQEVLFRDDLAIIPAGSQLSWQLETHDPDSDRAVQTYWRLSPGQSWSQATNEITLDLEQTGYFVLGAVLKDYEGAKTYKLWKLFVVNEDQNIPPMASILSPEPYATIPLGTPFDICGEVIDPDTWFDSCTPNLKQMSSSKDGEGRVYWSMNNGYFLEGIGARDIVIENEGRYQLNMFAFDGEYIDKKSTSFLIVDNETIPQPIIIHPAKTLRIQPGQTVYFEGTVPRGSLYKKFFVWEITKQGSPEFNLKIRQTTLGEYSFEEPGRYDVVLHATHPYNDSISSVSEKREIWVEAIPEISGNNSFETAVEMPAGYYRDNQIDGKKYFLIQLDQPGQNLKLHFDYDSPASVTLYNDDRIALGTGSFSGKTSIQLSDLGTGRYYIVFDPTENGKKQITHGDLSFGMGIDVSNAALYFPDIKNDTTYYTDLGMVNPSNEDVSAEIIAYDVNGGVLEKVPLQISAHGRVMSSIPELFPQNKQRVSWVRIDASHHLVGYSYTKSHDGLESYAMHGAEKLTSELYVPHIAQRTEQWYTLAKVINGSAETSNSSVVTGAVEKELKTSKRFSKDEFSMLDKFDGVLPEREWGVFKENNSQIRLAGAEIFGKVDGNRQTAGLLLDDNGQDNPNFTFIRNDIYFTHIARSIEQFWTGLAIVNPTDQQLSFRLIAYGDGGSVVGRKDYNMGPNEKLVDTATNMLADIGSPANIDWIKIEADQGIVGYELFGTHDNKRLAGLEGLNGLKKEICFPHLDTTGLSWHGVSVVNISENNASLTFQMISDSGDVLHETTRNLKSNEKLVSLVTELFKLDQIPANAGWVRCSSNQLIAGFELFGDRKGRHMSAVVGR
ncbi:MAG: hypothetical protein CSA81_03540 [Acidobacteria bacterium]|nr:MAG: hypothetical protein CSA81_03540 [Acidobacteriota bacterium]